MFLSTIICRLIPGREAPSHRRDDQISSATPSARLSAPLTSVRVQSCPKGCPHITPHAQARSGGRTRKHGAMRFREGATYPFLFAEDGPTETTTKARIDLPRVASDADLALKKLATGLGACADAQTELVKGGRRRTPEVLDGDERARRLFRIADPDGTGRCDEHRFTTLAESCGLNGEDARAALEACGGGPFIEEDAFVNAVGPHAEGRHHK